MPCLAMVPLRMVLSMAAQKLFAFESKYKITLLAIDC